MAACLGGPFNGPTRGVPSKGAGFLLQGFTGVPLDFHSQEVETQMETLGGAKKGYA